MLWKYLINIWRKYTFSPYILTFFYFSPYILFLLLLVHKLINAGHLSPWNTILVTKLTEKLDVVDVGIKILLKKLFGIFKMPKKN